jgi:RNA polymerase sigma-70 factor (ECF subfamily)
MSKRDVLADWLSRCANGDQAALEELYHACSAKLYAISLFLLKDKALAEDVLQDSFVKIWRRAGSYNRDKGSAMTWMASVVRHRALDVLRSNSYQVEQGFEDLASAGYVEDKQNPLMLADLSASTAAILRCMEQLKEEQRQCIVLAYYFGYSHDELSINLAKPLGTVKAWIRRGIKRIRECLD